MSRRLFWPILLLAAARAVQAAPPDLASKQVPGWAVDAIWYQIFPERFRNGDPNNDPTRASLEPPVRAGKDWQVSPWTADWYARDAWETAEGPSFYQHGVFERRYGGDLQGVLDKLDYLKDLGVNALYFCPLFYARSMHKYDGNSYHHIDPYFGPDPAGDFALIDRETSDPATWQWTAADRLFLRVVKEAHARGLRVILDGVFNHTGRDFFAFKNLKEKQQDSPYKDWYVVRSFDDPATVRNEFNYAGWWGHKTLPIFASAKNGHDLAPGPKKYIFDATRRWMDPTGKGNPADGIDGWRLDVADERPVEFWAEWNALVRRINPQAYTSAETWKTPKALVTAGGFSATMNYFGFAIPIKGWLADNHLTPTRFARQIDARRDALPVASAYAMQNLVDSHDTDRLASMIVNGERMPYQGRDADNVEFNSNNDLREAPGYLIRRPDERDRAVQRLIVLAQMTYVGAPMIYYGDEAGMWGAHDPDNRQPMVWEDLQYAPQTHDPRSTDGSEEAQPVAFDKELYHYYRDAIALRRAHPALCRGDYKLLDADDGADALAFSRTTDKESLVVAINRSAATQTLGLRVPPAVLVKPKIVFTTPGASAAETKASGNTLNVTLPPLTGIVVGSGD